MSVLCQLEGLDVNPFYSKKESFFSPTAQLPGGFSLFLKCIFYTDLFLWLYFVWNSFLLGFLSPFSWFVCNICFELWPFLVCRTATGRGQHSRDKYISPVMNSASLFFLAVVGHSNDSTVKSSSRFWPALIRQVNSHSLPYEDSQAHPQGSSKLWSLIVSGVFCFCLLVFCL